MIHFGSQTTVSLAAAQLREMSFPPTHPFFAYSRKHLPAAWIDGVLTPYCRHRRWTRDALLCAVTRALRRAAAATTAQERRVASLSRLRLHSISAARPCPLSLPPSRRATDRPAVGGARPPGRPEEASWPRREACGAGPDSAAGGESIDG